MTEAFLSMLDKRKKLHRELVQTLQTEFFQNMCNSIIPFAADVEKMGLEQEPIHAIAPNSVVSKAYQDLWDEVGELLA